MIRFRPRHPRPAPWPPLTLRVVATGIRSTTLALEKPRSIRGPFYAMLFGLAIYGAVALVIGLLV